MAGELAPFGCPQCYARGDDASLALILGPVGTAVMHCSTCGYAGGYVNPRLAGPPIVPPTRKAG